MKFCFSVFILSFVLLSTDASAWEMKKHEDMMTDEVRHQVCGLDTRQNEICFQYDGHELWLTITLSEKSTNVLAANRMPMLRVDKFQSHDINKLLELERSLRMHEKVILRQREARWLRYRIQTETQKGRGLEETNRNGLYYQLTSGEFLKIRLFIHGGYQADSKISLTGLPKKLSEMKSK